MVYYDVVALVASQTKASAIMAQLAAALDSWEGRPSSREHFGTLASVSSDLSEMMLQAQNTVECLRRLNNKKTLLPKENLKHTSLFDEFDQKLAERTESLVSLQHMLAQCLRYVGHEGKQEAQILDSFSLRTLQNKLSQRQSGLEEVKVDLAALIQDVQKSDRKAKDEMSSLRAQHEQLKTEHEALLNAHEDLKLKYSVCQSNLQEFEHKANTEKKVISEPPDKGVVRVHYPRSYFPRRRVAESTPSLAVISSSQFDQFAVSPTTAGLSSDMEEYLLEPEVLEPLSILSGDIADIKFELLQTTPVVARRSTADWQAQYQAVNSHLPQFMGRSRLLAADNAPILATRFSEPMVPLVDRRDFSDGGTLCYTPPREPWSSTVFAAPSCVSRLKQHLQASPPTGVNRAFPFARRSLRPAEREERARATVREWLQEAADKRNKEPAAM